MHFLQNIFSATWVPAPDSAFCRPSNTTEYQQDLPVLKRWMMPVHGTPRQELEGTEYYSTLLGGAGVRHRRRLPQGSRGQQRHWSWSVAPRGVAVIASLGTVWRCHAAGEAHHFISTAQDLELDTNYQRRKVAWQTHSMTSAGNGTQHHHNRRSGYFNVAI